MTIVVLAAGIASRMGSQKLLLPIDGQPMIVRVVAALAAWPSVVVVAGDDVAAALWPSGVRIVHNNAPLRGMAHSLALADAAIDAAEPIAVMLGDLPDIRATSIAAVVDGYDDAIDVVVPRHGEAFAHPVVFGPRARRLIPTLPDGDTLKRLRDDPRLRRRIVESTDSVPLDIDTPADYLRRTGTTESSRVTGDTVEGCSLR